MFKFQQSNLIGINMSKSQDNGDKGENEVIEKIKCPNCNRKLMLLPKNYPLVDVQCTG